MLDQIFITGSTGFVGKNLIKSLTNKYKFNFHNRGSEIKINSKYVIHLAGLAHDLKSNVNPNLYYQTNFEFTKRVFDSFLLSEAKVFITISSVKAVADKVQGELKEDDIPNPITHYGKSKLLAEQYIMSKSIPDNKRIYILRPCMIHGPGNKGNLNLLYNIVSKGFLWPLGRFLNQRSYLSIDNLCFIVKEIIEREDILSGVYNVADDLPLSTNEVIGYIAESKGQVAKILHLNKTFITVLARFGDFFKLPFNTERLHKLTESYVVCNKKIIKALGKPLPVSSKDGLLKTFHSFTNND
jgi:nucleoside-diphosphate-sugar epimerase